MKTLRIYEVALTGKGQNFFTLWRHALQPPTENVQGFSSHSFIQNLSIDFDEAVAKAREICGEDEVTERYEKRLVTDPDEPMEIRRLGMSREFAEATGVFVGGKHKGESVTDVFNTDKKYVEWVAKGGWMRMTDRFTGRQDSDFSETIPETSPVRQMAISLLVASGDWVERNGKLMPVERAEKLNYIDSLKPNPDLVDKKRVRGLKVKLLTNPFFVDGDWPKWVFKLVDANEYIYHASATTIPTAFYQKKVGDEFTMDFTPSIYNGKVYTKRIKFIF